MVLLVDVFVFSRLQLHHPPKAVHSLFFGQLFLGDMERKAGHAGQGLSQQRTLFFLVALFLSVH
jgi:hypothetical protein